MYISCTRVNKVLLFFCCFSWNSKHDFRFAPGQLRVVSPQLKLVSSQLSRFPSTQSRFVPTVQNLARPKFFHTIYKAINGYWLKQNKHCWDSFWIMYLIGCHDRPSTDTRPTCRSTIDRESTDVFKELPLMSAEVSTVTISGAYRSTIGGMSVVYHSIVERESTQCLYAYINT